MINPMYGYELAMMQLQEWLPEAEQWHLVKQVQRAHQGYSAFSALLVAVRRALAGISEQRAARDNRPSEIA